MPRLKEFDRPAATMRSTQPTISIRTRGTLGINKAAYEALGKPKAVKLLYGAEERVVGFRPTHEGSPNAYLVSETKPNGGYEVAGAAFFKFYGIAYDRTRRYVAQMQDGVLVFYLDRHQENHTEGV